MLLDVFVAAAHSEAARERGMDGTAAARCLKRVKEGGVEAMTQARAQTHILHSTYICVFYLYLYLSQASRR